MRYRIIIAFLVVPVVCLILFINSCRHDISITGQFDTICFDSKVLPIFIENCANTGCHDGKGKIRLKLNTYEEIRKDVTPYKSSQSRLYSAINSIWGNLMPPSKPLSEEQRMIIRIWIDQGAMHTTCPVDTSHYVPPPPVDTTKQPWVNPYACFSRDILPIFLSSCAGPQCHNGLWPEIDQKYRDLSSYSGIINSGLVVPYNVASSRFFTVVSGSGEEDIMPPPPRSPLNQTQIDSIKSWISRGAKDTICGETCDTTNVTFSGKVWPIMQNSCMGCHSGSTPPYGVYIRNYADVDTLVKHGNLVKVINRNVTFPMPPGYSLSKCKIRTIEIWVNAGAPNN